MHSKVFLFLLMITIMYNQSFSQVSFTSSNLPIIVINTNGKTIPDEPKIMADMGVIDNGPGNRNNITDPFNNYNGKIGIEIRGHSSQNFPKKQYGIELWDNSGNDIDFALLGFPEESDFVLNASYTDKSFMRNVLAYKLFNLLGRYASRTRYCEVVINGEYMGIYILQEKVKRDKNRVDIKKMSTTDISGDALTGGYLVKIDRVDPGDKYWTSPYAAVLGSTKAPVTYIHEYPNAADIVTQQQNYIKEHITKFETIMYSGKYKDPFAGYYSMVDIDSFVDYYLLNEFSKNTDGYRLSAFMYKNRDSEGGKLVMGPVWDYDISFGIANYDEGYSPYGWQAYKHYEGIWSSPFWTTYLMNDPVFKTKLAKRWNEVKNTIFSINSINKVIDENVAVISEAKERNFAKWKILGTYVWPEYSFPNTYEEEIANLKKWIGQRTAWLNLNIDTNYSDVEWLTPNFSNISFDVGREKKIALSGIIKSKLNISSIYFLSPTSNCKLEVKGDSLSITILKSGSYTFKGIGQKDLEVVSISPEYSIKTVTAVNDDNSLIPHEFSLLQNYPNPFNPSTIISYNLSAGSFVTIKIYDILGREIKTLVNQEMNAGRYSLNWNGEDNFGKRVASGNYIYRISAGNFVSSKRMILIK